VFPADVPPEECTFDYSRIVTRVENGQAVRIAYHLYRWPRGEKADISGVLGRCEFGLEIAVPAAFLMFVMRLSLDKARGLLKFFQELTLSKSQLTPPCRCPVPATSPPPQPRTPARRPRRNGQLNIKAYSPES